MSLMKYEHFSQWPADQWRWPDFSPREMASKREGELHLNTRAMDMLQDLRDRLGRPIVVVSAYRSPAHNKAVGGVKNSRHLVGEAFDIRMDNHDPVHFEELARAVGFRGFGFYPRQGFMHIDMGPAREWGKRWKKTATSLPEENRRRPPSRALTGAVVSGGAAVAAEAVPDAASEMLPSLAPAIGNFAPMVQALAVAAVIGFAIYLFWRARE